MSFSCVSFCQHFIFILSSSIEALISRLQENFLKRKTEIICDLDDLPYLARNETRERIMMIIIILINNNKAMIVAWNERFLWSCMWLDATCEVISFQDYKSILQLSERT